jgi:reductive dehalogenase
LKKSNNSILYSEKQLGPFPMHKIKRVEKPTNLITGDVQRYDMRDTAYGRAGRGEYGSIVQKGMKNLPPGKYPLSAAQKDVIEHIAVMKGNPVASQKAPITEEPEALSRHMKAVGHFLKADLVGICKPPQSAYYSHDKEGRPIEIKYENAIVIAMRKEANAMRTSKGFDWMGDPLSFQAYQHLGMVAETMADYVRRLGWDATAEFGPSFANRYTLVMPPLALMAGFGEVSRIGIIMNPFLGVAFKVAAVLTNMPLTPDKPIDFGAQSFCQNCKICAEVCPSKAISAGDKVMYNGYETWKLDTERCASFNFTNKNGTMCNRCVKACPWSNPPTWSHNLVRGLVTRFRLAQSIAIRASYLTGIGKHYPEDQWWFDIAYEDEELTILGKK